MRIAAGVLESVPDGLFWHSHGSQADTHSCPHGLDCVPCLVHRCRAVADHVVVKALNAGLGVLASIGAQQHPQRLARLLFPFPQSPLKFRDRSPMLGERRIVRHLQRPEQAGKGLRHPCRE